MSKCEKCGADLAGKTKSGAEVVRMKCPSCGHQQSNASLMYAIGSLVKNRRPE
jgi:DNA-directed RNA polymerase subunit M/transcription elongation factor TFIIS